MTAINLREGDAIETVDGIACITKIVKERHEEPVPVYNFHVKDWASYFVGKVRSYVHNGKPKDHGGHKPSNKPYKNNKEANEQAQKQGYKNAHDLKADYVGKPNVSKYDMKYDTQTKEIYLESKDGKIQIPTGLIHKS